MFNQEIREMYSFQNWFSMLNQECSKSATISRKSLKLKASIVHLNCGSEDTQEHLLICSKIVDCPVPAINTHNYDDLFSQDCLKVNTIAAILQRRFKIWEAKIKEGMGWTSFSLSFTAVNHVTCSWVHLWYFTMYFSD